MNKEKLTKIKRTAAVNIIGLTALFATACGCQDEDKKNINTTSAPNQTADALTQEIISTPTPAEKACKELSGFTWKHVEPEITVLVDENEFVIGDVFLVKNGNAIQLCDDKSETGLIINVRTPSLIYFKYGGDIRTVSKSKDKVDEIVKAKKEMLMSGLKQVDVLGISNTGVQKIQGK